MNDALPLPDYDQLSDKTLEHRIRSLDEDQLRTLLEYERTHAGRPAVELLLENRLRQLANGAEPSPGGETETLETSESVCLQSRRMQPVSTTGACPPVAPSRTRTAAR
jgi:hypothetical protein